MTNSPFEDMIESLGKDEGVYSLNDMRTSFNVGAEFSRDVAQDTIGELQAHVDAEPSDKVDVIRAKDDALAAARELIHTEQQTLSDPEGTLGTAYDSVLAIISNALILS